MMPEPDHPMRENLAWAQWWAFPWEHAHEDWKGDEYLAINVLYHRQRLSPRDLKGIATCLPAPPHPTVLRLALASNEQLELALTLVRGTVNPEAASPLSGSHHLWCMRLSKALPPDMLDPETDPLQLLYSWVDPATWQRLRLRFSRERVCKVEQQIAPAETASSRLNTLWQAVVWRVTTLADDPTPSGANE